MQINIAKGSQTKNFGVLNIFQNSIPNIDII